MTTPVLHGRRSEIAAGVPVTHHRTLAVDGVNMFYREAGRADAQVVLLLHGFPTSSHMFRNLIPALADRYRVIAPDYPAFGQSEMRTAPRSRTRSTALPRSSMPFSISSASRVSRCTSWTTGVPWAGGSR